MCDMRVRPPQTIKCWCGWDSGIETPNLLVIYHDVVCPKCGNIVVIGIEGPKPSPWFPNKPFPNKRKEWLRFDSEADLSCVRPQNRYLMNSLRAPNRFSSVV